MRTLFVAGSRQGRAAGRGDRQVPLDALAQATLGSNGEPSDDLRRREEEAPHHVLADLVTFVDALRVGEGTGHWLRAGTTDLTAAFRWPDGAAFGFPGQWLAHHVACATAPAGDVAYWGNSAFQWRGLCAALGREVVRVEPLKRAPTESLVASLPLLRTQAAVDGERCDILYLALEPHVAVQQDRLLALLAARHRLRVVVPLRRPWPWPAGTRFRPEAVLPLRAYVTAGDYARLAASLARRVAASRGRLPGVAWMPPAEGARWVRRTWLRAGDTATALRRAIEVHRPRLLLGTNLASGLGCVVAQVAAEAGVEVVGLPTGADYLLPPLFAPGITRHARIVVPGEGIRARLVAAGADPDRLEACGWPEFDDLVMAPAEPRAALLRRMSLGAGRRLVVFFSSPSAGDEELLVPPKVKSAALEALATTCRELDLDVVVKLHPRETDDAVASVAARADPPIPVVRGDLAGLLHAADVVASLGSAVGFAAAVLGKPVLLLGFGALPAVSAMSEALAIGAAPADLPALRDFLRRAATDAVEPRTDLLGGDGGSSQRIAALVDRLLA